MWCTDFLYWFQMMGNMGGEDDLPDLDGADDVRLNHV